LLSGGKRGEYFIYESFFFDLLDELLDDFKMNVGFEQRDANFAQRVFHIGSCELAFAAQIFENPLQLAR